MEQELRKHGIPWPRFEPAHAADPTAFRLTSRGAVSAPKDVAPPRK
jgi:hypothetical protein